MSPAVSQLVPVMLPDATVRSVYSVIILGTLGLLLCLVLTLPHPTTQSVSRAQVFRLSAAGLGLLAAVLVAVMLPVRYGWDTVMAVLEAVRAASPVIGWALTLCYWALVLSPVLVALDLWLTAARPARRS